MSEIKFKKNVRYMQEGGAVEGGEAAAAPAEAPANAGAQQQPQSPEEQMLQMMVQAVETQDGNLALQACQMCLQLLSQGQGAQGGAPAMKNGGVIAKKKIIYRNGRATRVV